MIRKADDLAIDIYNAVKKGDDKLAIKLITDDRVSLLEMCREVVRGILPNARLADDASEEINKVWASL